MFIRQITLAALIIFSNPVLANTFTAKVISVYDGDTITVRTANNTTIKVRLAEIDAPEKNQPWGIEAGSYLGKRLINKDVTLSQVAVDQYGRSVAHVLLGKSVLNVEMVATGNAWVYPSHLTTKGLTDVQRKAERNKLGLWSLPNQVAPWDWRKGAKTYQNVIQKTHTPKSVTVFDIAIKLINGKGVPEPEQMKKSLSTLIMTLFAIYVLSKMRLLKKIPNKLKYPMIIAALGYSIFW